MKEKKTEVVFILDKSGSMHGLEKDTIGGFNAMLEKQKKEEGECYISTILFSSRSQSLYQHKEISTVKPLTNNDYQVGGCTALLDAIGYAIDDMKDYLKIQKEKRNVLFIIITDGMENASHEYSSRIIKRMVEEQQEKEGWSFTFLGANIDAIQTASDIGIRKEYAANYHNDSLGVQENFRAVSNMVRRYRACGKMDSDWKKDIEKDYEKRAQ